MSNKGDFLFRFLNNITYEKDSKFMEKASEEELKSCNTFILNRWLSMDSGLIVLADALNPLAFYLPVDQYHRICCSMIPKGKVFFKWISGKKTDKQKVNDFLIDIVCQEYECSKKEAKEYLSVLNLDTTQNISILYNVIKKYPLTDHQLKLLGIKREDLHHQVVYQTVVETKKEEKKQDLWEADLFE